MRRRWSALALGTGAVAVTALSVALAIAVNVATESTADWWPSMNDHPLPWLAACTALTAGLTLATWWANGRTERVETVQQARLLLMARVLLVETRSMEVTLKGQNPIEIPLTATDDGRERDVDIAGVAAAIRAGTWGRILLLGDSGAGKTVACLRIILELLEPLRANAEGAQLIPVRVPAATWTEGRTLNEWLKERIEADYGIPAAAAALLVEQKFILPVIDGLDELDAPVGNRSPAGGERARSLLAEINQALLLGKRHPVIVTCRRERVRGIFGGPGKRLKAHLAGSVQIVVQPLGSDQIRRYVEGRHIGDPEAQQEWQPILDQLDDDSGRVARRVLVSPWRLVLATTVIPAVLPPSVLLCDAAKSPAGVAEQARQAARLLIDQFIPAALKTAAARRREKDDGRRAGLLNHRYLLLRPHPAAAPVHRWLRSLAQAQRNALSEPGAPRAARSHIIVHLLWTAMPPAEIRAVHRSWSGWFGWAAGLAFLVLVLTGLGLSGAWPVALLGSLVIGALVRYRCGRIPWPRLHAAAPIRTPAPQQWKAAARGAWIGAAPTFATVSPLAFLLRPPAQALALTLIGVVVGGLLSGNAARLAATSTSWAMDANIATPRRAIRRAAAAQLFHFPARAATGVTGLVVMGLPFGAAISLSLLISFILFLMTEDGMAVFRHYVGLLTAVVYHRLPMRAGRFLDWSATIGLLRASGAAYQFRHRELAEWLLRPETAAPADRPEPPGGRQLIGAAR